MKQKGHQEFQSFPDGICAIYTVKNAAAPGDTPREQLELLHRRIPVARRVVGVTRYWTGAQAGTRITEVLRIPQHYSVSSQHICLFNGQQYRIRQVQHIPDSMPRSTDLSLERVEVDYDIAPIS